jgi:putative endonuclease
MHTRSKGAQGEKLALDYLLKHGYKNVQQNYYTRYGEIDLIVWDIKNQELVFVEVKTRSSDKFGKPEDAIGQVKMNRIMDSADYYLGEVGYYEKYRFDCLAVEMNDRNEVIKITHFKNIN